MDRYVIVGPSEDLGYKLLLLFTLASIDKVLNVHIAMAEGFGNAGGAHEPLAWQRQMAVLLLPYGKSERTDNSLLQS